MENPPMCNRWTIYFYGSLSMAMLNNQRVWVCPGKVSKIRNHRSSFCAGPAHAAADHGEDRQCSGDSEEQSNAAMDLGDLYRWMVFFLEVKITNPSQFCPEQCHNSLNQNHVAGADQNEDGTWWEPHKGFLNRSSMASLHVPKSGTYWQKNWIEWRPVLNIS